MEFSKCIATTEFSKKDRSEFKAVWIGQQDDRFENKIESMVSVCGSYEISKTTTIRWVDMSHEGYKDRWKYHSTVESDWGIYNSQREIIANFKDRDSAMRFLFVTLGRDKNSLVERVRYLQGTIQHVEGKNIQDFDNLHKLKQMQDFLVKLVFVKMEEYGLIETAKGYPGVTEEQAKNKDFIDFFGGEVYWVFEEKIF